MSALRPNGAEITFGSILVAGGLMFVAQSVWSNRLPGSPRGIQFFKTAVGRWIWAAMGLVAIGAGAWVIVTNA